MVKCMNENKKDNLNNSRHKVCYDYSKRTKGGFSDALFLVGILITAGMWFMLMFIGR